MSPFILGCVAVFAPLLVCFTLLIAGPLRRQGTPAAALSIAAALASFGASFTLFWQQVSGAPQQITVFPWLISNGETIATLGLQVDGISSSMLVVVSLVALCVQIFSLSYMAGEPKADFGRYFTWHAGFLFSMQALVVSPNLLQLFAAWELVGLCSYLLIGFYYTKPSAARAAVKAFWVTKFADMGFLLGLIVQYVYAGGFGWDPQTVENLDHAGYMGLWAIGLYFLAIMGKSAQFPFHIWLPDAMEGPTPVSALLHAATMVAAGVYFIVRAFPLFMVADELLPFISLIGGFTALFAAVIACVQTDIKKVLAYSTCSQLGYMVASLGAGSLMGGYFHLSTHAFFKALLFLAAGSVIHGVHSNQLTDMGGLRKTMPYTTGAFLIGSAALAGLPVFSGFFSKDLVLESLLHAAQHEHPLYWLPLVFCLVAAGLTAFYMGRVVLLAFFGAPSEAAKHAHEGGPALLIPLAILSLFALSAGFAGPTFAAMWGVSYHFEISPVGLTALTLSLAGLGLSYVLFYQNRAQNVRAWGTPVNAFVQFGAVDRLWTWGYAHALRLLGAGFAWVDRYLIDASLNAAAVLTLNAGQRVRKTQTGNVGDYLYIVITAFIVLTAGQVWLTLGAS